MRRSPTAGATDPRTRPSLQHKPVPNTALFCPRARSTHRRRPRRCARARPQTRPLSARAALRSPRPRTRCRGRRCAPTATGGALHRAYGRSRDGSARREHARTCTAVGCVVKGNFSPRFRGVSANMTGGVSSSALYARDGRAHARAEAAPRRPRAQRSSPRREMAPALRDAKVRQPVYPGQTVSGGRHHGRCGRAFRRCRKPSLRLRAAEDV